MIFLYIALSSWRYGYATGYKVAEREIKVVMCARDNSR